MLSLDFSSESGHLGSRWVSGEEMRGEGRAAGRASRSTNEREETVEEEEWIVVTTSARVRVIDLKRSALVFSLTMIPGEPMILPCAFMRKSKDEYHLLSLRRNLELEFRTRRFDALDGGSAEDEEEEQTGVSPSVLIFKTRLNRGKPCLIELLRFAGESNNNNKSTPIVVALVVYEEDGRIELRTPTSSSTQQQSSSKQTSSTRRKPNESSLQIAATNDSAVKDVVAYARIVSRMPQYTILAVISKCEGGRISVFKLTSTSIEVVCASVAIPVRGAISFWYVEPLLDGTSSSHLRFAAVSSENNSISTFSLNYSTSNVVRTSTFFLGAPDTKDDHNAWRLSDAGVEGCACRVAPGRGRGIEVWDLVHGVRCLATTTSTGDGAMDVLGVLGGGSAKRKSLVIVETNGVRIVRNVRYDSTIATALRIRLSATTGVVTVLGAEGATRPAGDETLRENIRKSVSEEGMRKALDALWAQTPRANGAGSTPSEEDEIEISTLNFAVRTCVEKGWISLLTSASLLPHIVTLPDSQPHSVLAFLLRHGRLKAVHTLLKRCRDLPTEEIAALVRLALELIVSPGNLSPEQKTSIDASDVLEDDNAVPSVTKRKNGKSNDDDDDDDGREDDARSRKILALLSSALTNEDLVEGELSRSLIKRLDAPLLAAFAAVCHHLAAEREARGPEVSLRLMSLAASVLDAARMPGSTSLRPLGEFVSRELMACEAAQEVLFATRRVLASLPEAVVPSSSTTTINKRVKKQRRSENEDDGYRIETFVL